MDEVLKKASRVIIDSSGKGMSGVVPYMSIQDQKDKPAAAASAQQGASR